MAFSSLLFLTLLVFVLSGIWHGANRMFVLWGLYHGLLDLFERTSIGKRSLGSLPRWLAIPLTFALVVVGWVFFRAKDMSQAFVFLEAMSGLGASPAVAKLATAQLLPHRSLFFLGVGLALVAVRAVFGRPREGSPWQRPPYLPVDGERFFAELEREIDSSPPAPSPPAN